MCSHDEEAGSSAHFRKVTGISDSCRSCIPRSRGTAPYAARSLRSHDNRQNPLVTGDAINRDRSRGSSERVVNLTPASLRSLTASCSASTRSLTLLLLLS